MGKDIALTASLLLALAAEAAQQRAELSVTADTGICYVRGKGRADNRQERAGAPCWDFARCPRDGARPTDENLWAWPGTRLYSGGDPRRAFRRYEAAQRLPA